MRKNYPWPSIIRLSRFVRVPYKKVVLTRKNILRRDGYKCAYCGRGDLTLTMDHIIPKAKEAAMNPGKILLVLAQIATTGREIEPPVRQDYLYL